MKRTVSSIDRALIWLFLIEASLAALCFAVTGDAFDLLCALLCPWMAYRQWVRPFREILSCSFIFQLD